MSATVIVSLIASVVVISILVIYIGQAREKARLERQRQINALQDRYRRMHRLLSELPGQYLNKDLQLLLIDRAVEALSQMDELRAGNDTAERLTQCNELKEQIMRDEFKPAPIKIDTPEKLKEVHQLLESLFRYLETSVQQSTLDPATAKRNMVYIGYLVRRIKADLQIARAEEGEKAKKPRVAIHHYHLAVEELIKCKNNPSAVAAINSYRAKIKVLEKMAEGDAAEVAAKKRDEVKINEEWEKFADKGEDEWKKRADYDN